MYFCVWGIKDLKSIFSLNILFNKQEDYISEKALRLLGLIFLIQVVLLK